MPARARLRGHARLQSVPARRGLRRHRRADYIAGPDQKQFSRLFPSYHSMLANLLGLRFIATSVPIEQVDTHLKPGELRLVARTSDAYIYENPDTLPRVLFVTNWMRTDFGDLVDRGNWPDFDPATTVLLEERPAPRWDQSGAREPVRVAGAAGAYQAL